MNLYFKYYDRFTAHYENEHGVEGKLYIHGDPYKTDFYKVMYISHLDLVKDRNGIVIFDSRSIR